MKRYSDNIKMQRTPPELATRKGDYNLGGFHAEPHDFHRLWFEFLLLSPSYELARRYRTNDGKLSTSDVARLPEDFDQVLAVFDDFGDLQRVFFKHWLRQRGLRLFGNQGEKPYVKQLHSLDSSVEDHAAHATKAVQDYLRREWTQQSRPDALLVAVPLSTPKAQALREFKKLLDQHMAATEPVEAGKYQLMNKGMHRQNIIDAMAVLYVRAARPSFKLWQVGVEAKVSPTYSALFDSKTSKRTADNATDFRILEMMTSRKLRLAKHLVENAARGRFPDQSQPKHMVDFDPKEFNRIIASRNRWIKEKFEKIKEAKTNI